MGGLRPFNTYDWPGAMHPSNRYTIGHHDLSRTTKGFARPAGGISAGLLAAPPVRGGMLGDGSEFFDSRLRPGDALSRPLLEDPGAAERDFSQREHKRPNLGLSGYMEGYVEGGGPNFDARFMEGHAKAYMPSNESWHTNVMLYKGMHPGFERVNTGDTFMADQGAPWKGSIAKAGMFVCRVQSFPVGKGIDDSLPGVVNCVARTSLDLLAQHFFQAVDYGIIYFVPDRDSESASFQEFVSYLGDKHRAGVAKTSDGTTLFLVPPSDFAENVLKLHGDCLFGLVIKFHQTESIPTNYPPQGPPQPHAHLQTRIASKEEAAVVTTLGSATMLPPRQAAGAQLTSELRYSTGSLSCPPRSTSLDDAEANGGGTPSDADIMENAPHDNEARGIQDHSRSFQAPWQGSSGQQTLNWEPAVDSSTAMDPSVHMSVAGSAEARPNGAVEQVLASLQAASNDPAAATQALLRQALLSQSGAAAGSDASSNTSAVDALKTGLLRREGASEGEASNRFQATLQLAAALLQRMHNGKGPAGPTS